MKSHFRVVKFNLKHTHANNNVAELASATLENIVDVFIHTVLNTNNVCIITSILNQAYDIIENEPGAEIHAIYGYGATATSQVNENSEQATRGRHNDYRT